MERDVGWNFSNGLTGRGYCCHKATTWNVKIESLCSPQFCFCNRNTPCFFSIAWVNHQQPRSLWGLPKTCCFQIFGTDCTPGGYRESVALWNAELNRRDLNPIPSFWSWKQWYGRTCTTGQSQHEIPDLRMMILFEPFKNAGIWTVFILWCHRKNTPSIVLRCVFKNMLIIDGSFVWWTFAIVYRATSCSWKCHCLAHRLCHTFCGVRDRCIIVHDHRIYVVRESFPEFVFLRTKRL